MSKPGFEISQQLAQAADLHQRTASDYKKCLIFNRLLAELFDQLEEKSGYQQLSNRLMSILLDCNPREGSQCEKAALVAERIKKLHLP